MHKKGAIEEAIYYYNLSIQNGYKDERVLLNLGAIYQQNKNFKEAIKYYDQVIKQNPKSSEHSRI